MASVTISMGVLENYAAGVHVIGDTARSDFEATLRAIDLSDQALVEDLLAGACRAASQASSEYAAQFYRGMSILQTGNDYDARAYSPYDRKAVEVALKGIYRQARDADGALDEEKLARLLSDRIDYEVNRASKVGVWRNGQVDSRDVRYARVPVGAETCAWCLMTAGLGFWFMTEEAASHTHAHCDCAIIPEIGGIHDVHIDGYDSTVYRDMWRNANQLLRNGDIPSDMAERIDYLAATRPGYRTDTNGALAVMRWQYGLK